MINLHDRPGWAKKRILTFLKNRGGKFNCGKAEVWQILYSQCFGGGEGSSHDAVDNIRKYVLELEEEKQIVLSRDERGFCNFMCLPSIAEDDRGTGGELTQNELAEILADVLARNTLLEERLRKAETKVEEADTEAGRFKSELRQTEAKNDELEAEIGSLRAQIDFEGVRKIVKEQESEIAKLREEKRMAEVDLQEAKAEARSVLSKLGATQESLNGALAQTQKLQRKIDRDTLDLKALRKEKDAEILALRQETEKLKNGGGLTAGKTAAIAINAMDALIDEFWRRLPKAVLDDCVKRKPDEDEQETFRKEVNREYNKIRRRDKRGELNIYKESL